MDGIRWQGEDRKGIGDLDTFWPGAGSREPGAGSREPGVVSRLTRIFDAERERLVRVAAANGPESWAEDVIHDAWIKVSCGEIRSTPPFPTEEQLLEWFLQVVRNEARNRRRTERIRFCEPFHEEGDVAGMHPGDSDPLLEDIVVGAAGKLPSAQREVSQLRLSGWRLVDIALETKRTEGTVKRLWYRSRSVLRNALGPYLER